ncbi:MAG: hypothetical protein AB1563_05100 [Bacillota bacterium]
MDNGSARSYRRLDEVNPMSEVTQPANDFVYVGVRRLALYRRLQGHVQDAHLSSGVRVIAVGGHVLFFT